MTPALLFTECVEDVFCNLRAYFFREDAAVRHLNFDWPNFEQSRGSSDAKLHDPDTNAMRSKREKTT